MEDDSFTLAGPVKHAGYQSSVDSDRSASKRKRTHHHASPDDSSDTDLRTPKRNRPHVTQNADDNATPAHQHSVRRKRGIRNLSDLSLSHATESQPTLQSPRESKFQEGSLTNKPSEAPPSIYTRVTRTESGNLTHMDDLMAEYHQQGTDDPRNAEADATTPMSSAAATEHQDASFFRFGRSLATSFHPVTLWNRIWNEQKEELTRQHLLEAERRAKLKAEAEVRYAELKKAGQFTVHPVAAIAGTEDAASTPYDSAVSLESAGNSQTHRRISSVDSRTTGTHAVAASGDKHETPDTVSKTLRSIRSRLHLKRPSLSSLKRVKSDINIAGSLPRDSSSSASPVKIEFEDATLRRTRSKYDLKKQQKLSKRVSDLELKLQKARRELEGVLADASPATKLGSSTFGRFTPTPTHQRPRFVPGRLPTLPSERLLFPELAAEDPIIADTDSDEEDNQETIKASREKQYPTRADALFQLEPESADTISITKAGEPLEHTSMNSIASQETEMDPNNPTMAVNDSTITTTDAEYSALDLKLKALDQSYKASRKSGGSKKRKSGGAVEDAAFKIGKEDDGDDDAEWEEANQTPQKRRKSGPPKTKATPGKGGEGIRSESKLPRAKKSKTSLERATTVESSENGSVAEDSHGDTGADEHARSSQFRNSVDLQAQPLEPVYEEEEEVITVPLKDEPSRPTAKATPARYGRPRPLSPPALSHSTVQAGSEEVIITRAAGAAQKRRSGRPASPPPGVHSEVMDAIDEVVTAIPGQQDVPAMPPPPPAVAAAAAPPPGDEMLAKTTTGSPMARKPSFQWPDDVF